MFHALAFCKIVHFSKDILVDIFPHCSLTLLNTHVNPTLNLVAQLQ